MSVLPARRYRRGPLAALPAVVVWLALATAGAQETGTLAATESGRGETIYRRSCASCHGAEGEGVKGKHSRPLVGDKSLMQLVRYVEKWMPEEEPETCVGEDAERVARFVFDTFYSPIAQARRKPPRVELARLTVRQYRQTLADLVGSFRPPFAEGDQRGLRGEYFNSRRPRGRSALRRVDPEIRFDFGRSTPEKLDNEGFSARWDGSVVAPATGAYQLIVRTDHAARLWLNDLESPLIDAWVKSGDETEYRASIFLVDGRAYPLRLEFTSRNQGVDKKEKDRSKPREAFVELRWRRPGHVAEVIPGRYLLPEKAPEVFVIDTSFPPDDRSIGYERGTSISKAWDGATTSAAIEAADYVAEHIEELAGVEPSARDASEGLRRFCEQFVERAFRRPLTAEVRERYVGRQFSRAPTPESAVKRVVLLALKSPRFLFVDLAGERPDGYTVASRLSFALWDSLPDSRLFEAAEAGALLDEESVRRHAEAMLRDRRARAKIRQFFYQWLEVDHFPELAKDPALYSGFGEALASDLRTSLDLFLDDVIWGEDPDFRRLLLSGDLYVNGRLAGYYGFDLPADAPFRKVRAREAQRLGLLAHPYLMARFAYPDSSSPIHRGVFIVRSVLGRVLRPPPEAVAPLAPNLHPDLTTRERVSKQTEARPCQTCHSMINPLGFALEHFDAVGRFREDDRNRPIDSSGSYELLTGGTRSFQDGRELAEFLATSEEVHRTFVARLFHYLVKQPIMAFGVDTPEALRKHFAATGFDVRETVVHIASLAALSSLQEISGLESSARGRHDRADERAVRLRRF